MRVYDAQRLNALFASAPSSKHFRGQSDKGSIKRKRLLFPKPAIFRHSHASWRNYMQCNPISNTARTGFHRGLQCFCTQGREPLCSSWNSSLLVHSIPRKRVERVTSVCSSLQIRSLVELRNASDLEHAAEGTTKEPNSALE